MLVPSLHATASAIGIASWDYALGCAGPWWCLFYVLGLLTITALIAWRDGTKHLIDHTLLMLLLVLVVVILGSGTFSWSVLLYHHLVPSLLVLALGYLAFRRNIAGGGDGKYITILMLGFGLSTMGIVLVVCVLLCCAWMGFVLLCSLLSPKRQQQIFPRWLQKHGHALLENPRKYKIPLGVPLGISVWILLFLIGVVDNSL